MAAATTEMGEIDEVHTKEDGPALNGDVVDGKEQSTESVNNMGEEMEVDETSNFSNATKSTEHNIEEDHGDEQMDDSSMPANSVEMSSGVDENSRGVDEVDGKDQTLNESIDHSETEANDDEKLSVNSADNSDVKNDGDPLSGDVNESAVELNDSGEDIMIMDQDAPKQNGTDDQFLKIKSVESLAEDQSTVITIDTPVKKKKKALEITKISPRRSSRNLNKQKSYVESDKEEEAEEDTKHSEESDIEEVLPQDPLALSDSMHSEKAARRGRGSGPAIVVKDTKRLVEIASKSSPSNTGGKKEPTLVIIDTNSILSGRGPIPLIPTPQSKPSPPKPVPSMKPTMAPSYPMLPMALPAQGIYPPNMRATITPIPIATAPQPPPPKPAPPPPPPAPVLPTLTDDMFVVEAPSFIVPYVYEKPPLKEFKDFVKDLEKELAELKKKKKEEQKDEKDESDDKDSEEKEEEKSESGKEKKDTDKSDADEDDKKIIDMEDTEESTESKKSYSYFDSPLGKFFIDIGQSLVQEFVQADLLKQQKRKRDREQGQNNDTNKTIMSLLKTLEYTKENNEPFKMEMKKCEFCSFKTESSLAMAFHLETPHMKNFVYRCNFCPYEVRSPHDILFHMEAEHAVRGRLERAPAFHQCPSCPFEDNQKGKLSRHLVACMRKFKPERNLEPPVDWEPPAKIPRVPRMKQPHLNTTASVYQALSKNPQYQMFTKMQANSVIHRGRGRPSLGTTVMTKQPQQQLLRTSAGMVYKQAMSGGSVLLPTSYQLSGNQLYQVVGGQELGGRIGPVGPMAFVPNMSSAASTVTIQQQNSNKSKPVHQPSISITPLPRASTTAAAVAASKPGDSNSKTSFVICEICDGYIKDLEQLRNHMQWIHKVKIHPKMIYNRPPLNCQKCQFRFFTDQGLERHLLGSHGLVTSSMQEAANKSKDAGRCPVCGRVYQWKLLNHVARDHNVTLKPAHLSYKCTVCTATFGMYKQFENHVYSAHSVVAKRVMDKKSSAPTGSKNDTLLKPLKINDEITIIPQPTKSTNLAGTSKDNSPMEITTGSRNSNGNGISITAKRK